MPADHHSEYLARTVAALTPEGRARVDEFLDQMAAEGAAREWVVRFATARHAEADEGRLGDDAEPGWMLTEAERQVLVIGFKTIRDGETHDDVADWANAVLALLEDVRSG